MYGSDDWIDDSGGVAPDYRADLEDIAALDALTVGSDRHGSNMIVNLEIKGIFPIDNGLNYVERNVPIEEVVDSIADRLGRTELIGITLDEMNEPDRHEIEEAYNWMTPDNDIISVPISFFEGSQLSPDLHDRLSRLQSVLERKDSKICRTLLDAHQLFFGEKKGRRLFDRLKANLNGLVSLDLFPKNSPLFEMEMGKKKRLRIEKMVDRRADRRGPSRPSPSIEAKRSAPPPLPRPAANG